MFTRSTNLKTHKRINSHEDPFTFDKCDKTFKRNDYLKKHKRVNSGNKPFSCDYVTSVNVNLVIKINTHKIFLR